MVFMFLFFGKQKKERVMVCAHQKQIQLFANTKTRIDMYLGLCKVSDEIATNALYSPQLRFSLKLKIFTRVGNSHDTLSSKPIGEELDT